MHEMTIAMSIVEILCNKAAEENAKRINYVLLNIGSLSGVMTDALEFCFEAATKNTIAEGAELKINHINGKAVCKNCNKEFKLKTDFSSCPSCDDFNFEIIEGKELNIKSFNID
jgi:hydrogenase nickel incorporation protein HypA/HybF